MYECFPQFCIYECFQNIIYNKSFQDNAIIFPVLLFRKPIKQMAPKGKKNTNLSCAISNEQV